MDIAEYLLKSLQIAFSSALGLWGIPPLGPGPQEEAPSQGKALQLCLPSVTPTISISSLPQHIL